MGEVFFNYIRDRVPQKSKPGPHHPRRRTAAPTARKCQRTRTTRRSNSSLINIEALCVVPPEALPHSPSHMPLSCPVAPATLFAPRRLEPRPATCRRSSYTVNVAATGAGARRGAGQQVTSSLRLAQWARESAASCLHRQLRGYDDEGAVATLEGTDAAAGACAAGEAPEEDKGFQGSTCERDDGRGKQSRRA